MALLSQAAFAKRQGWSRQYVSKLAASGKIPLHNGKIDPDEALKALESQAEPSTTLRTNKTTSVTPTDSRQAVDFVTARTMREAFKAKMAKLEYEEKSSKLTDAAKVKEDAFQTGRIVRDTLLGIPDRMADVLAAENDSKSIQVILCEEIEIILEQLSRKH